MLRIEGLRRPGLAPVDLHVEAGTCVAVTGPSGSGKSLFLRAIADLDPTEGEVFLDGVRRSEMAAPDWRRRVGYLAAEPAWWAATAAAHFPAPVAEARIRQLGLTAEILDRPVRDLSTGERQRLALLRVLAREPRVTLLDEPTSALDADSRRQAETVLRDGLAGGRVLLLVTHDRELAARLAGRHLDVESGVVRERTP